MVAAIQVYWSASCSSIAVSSSLGLLPLSKPPGRRPCRRAFRRRRWWWARWCRRVRSYRPVPSRPCRRFRPAWRRPAHRRATVRRRGRRACRPYRHDRTRRSGRRRRSNRCAASRSSAPHRRRAHRGPRATPHRSRRRQPGAISVGTTNRPAATTAATTTSPAQPRHEVGAARQQDPGRRAGQQQRRRTDHAHPEQVAMPPRQHRSAAHQRRDRRGERHRVVRVEDARHETERQAGDEQPCAPHDQRRRGSGRSGCLRPRSTIPSDEQHERRRDQPGDLPALRGLEHAGDAGGSPHAAATAGTAVGHAAGESAGRVGRGRTGPVHAPRHDTAGLVAAQPAETVVTEGEFEDRIVLRATDPRPRRRRPQFDDQQSTSRRIRSSPRAAANSCQIRLPSLGGPATR